MKFNKHHHTRRKARNEESSPKDDSIHLLSTITSLKHLVRIIAKAIIVTPDNYSNVSFVSRIDREITIGILDVSFSVDINWMRPATITQKLLVRV